MLLRDSPAKPENNRNFELRELIGSLSCTSIIPMPDRAYARNIEQLKETCVSACNHAKASLYPTPGPTRQRSGSDSGDEIFDTISTRQHMLWPYPKLRQ